MANRKQSDEVELCAGCGAEAPEGGFGVVAVMSDPSTGEFYAAGVCPECHADPAHRKQPLKAHFHDRANAAVAVDSAQRNILAQDPNSVIRRSPRPGGDSPSSR